MVGAKLVHQEVSQVPGALGGSQVEAPAVGKCKPWAGAGDTWLIRAVISTECLLRARTHAE